MSKYTFKLYIAGQSPNSTRAIENLKSFCEEVLKKQYEIDVINVIENPQLAVYHNIIATPTLVRETPSPAQRIIGDLSNKEKLMSMLGTLSSSQT